MICRSCGGSTTPLFDLGMQPLANSLLDSPQDSYETHPLDVRLCETCHLGQLHDLVPPEKMFRKYAYYTSISGPSVESARKLVERIVFTNPAPGMVVEIGSNDGYLLQFYRQRSIPVLGIDPAHGPANAAALLGIPTVKDFFGLDMAPKLPRADIIHANNVLAHVPHLNDFVAGLEVLLKPDGVCYVEVPYLRNILENCEFDTIYCEHSYYFSFLALSTLFNRYGLFIVNTEHLPVHGGSLRLEIRKQPSTFNFPENLLSYFVQSRMEGISLNLMAALRALRADGRSVWGFGAAAKATVMMNYCGITSNLVDAVADDTPVKREKYIPGTGVQVRSSQNWLAAQPDYTCIFAWNYASQIIDRYHDLYRGTFFTPYNLESVRERVG